jgi:hypothetical protein
MALPLDLPGRPKGIAIPWFAAGERLALVKLRQPEGARPKYREVFRDRPTIYPGPRVIQPGRPLVIVEGELDALLLGQELADLDVSVVTLGSASARPVPSILRVMLTAAPWFVATDNDEAGNKAAGEWPTAVKRVRPPGAFKDWTEAAQGGADWGWTIPTHGINLRRWWTEILAGNLSPPLYTWEELSTWRWGFAVGDLTPGTVNDQPDHNRMVEALSDPGRLDDTYATEERAAIQDEG